MSPKPEVLRDFYQAQELETIPLPRDVAHAILDMIAMRAWGKVTLRFQAGELEQYDVEKTAKVRV